jgi:hypothetical protein
MHRMGLLQAAFETMDEEARCLMIERAQALARDPEGMAKRARWYSILESLPPEAQDYVLQIACAMSLRFPAEPTPPTRPEVAEPRQRLFLVR